MEDAYVDPGLFSPKPNNEFSPQNLFQSLSETDHTEGGVPPVLKNVADNFGPADEHRVAPKVFTVPPPTSRMFKNMTDSPKSDDARGNAPMAVMVSPSPNTGHTSALAIREIPRNALFKHDQDKARRRLKHKLEDEKAENDMIADHLVIAKRFEEKQKAGEQERLEASQKRRAFAAAERRLDSDDKGNNSTDSLKNVDNNFKDDRDARDVRDARNLSNGVGPKFLDRSESSGGKVQIAPNSAHEIQDTLAIRTLSEESHDREERYAESYLRQSLKRIDEQKSRTIFVHSMKGDSQKSLKDSGPSHVRPSRWQRMTTPESIEAKRQTRIRRDERERLRKETQKLESQSGSGPSHVRTSRRQRMTTPERIEAKRQSQKRFDERKRASKEAQKLESQPHSRETSQTIQQKGNERLQKRNAQRRATLERREETVRDALRRLNSRGNPEAIKQEEENSSIILFDNESSSSSDEDEDDDRTHEVLPIVPDIDKDDSRTQVDLTVPTIGRPTVGGKGISEATLARMYADAQGREGLETELTSEDERMEDEAAEEDDDEQLEVLYKYHIKRREWRCDEDEAQARESDFGPFYDIEEANDIACQKVRPNESEAAGLRPGAYSIEVNQDECGMQSHFLKLTSGNFQTTVSRTIVPPQKTNDVPLSAFRFPKTVWVVRETTSSANDVKSFSEKPQTGNSRVFSVLELANKAAGNRWLEESTRDLQCHGMDGIKRAEMKMILRNELVAMTADGQLFSRHVVSPGTWTSFWVEQLQMEGPRN